MPACETLPGENEIVAENVRKAVVKYLAARPSRRSAPFDRAWAMRLHREMFGDVWSWAGSPRTSVTNLGVPPAQIEPQLDSLMADLAHWEDQGIDVMRQAVMLHHRAVQIHPFENGNGRWARLLANIRLKMHDSPPTEWPETTIGAESTIRAAYIDALKAADDGDYGPLQALHERFTPRGDSRP